MWGEGGNEARGSRRACSATFTAQLLLPPLCCVQPVGGGLSEATRRARELYIGNLPIPCLGYQLQVGAGGWVGGHRGAGLHVVLGGSRHGFPCTCSPRGTLPQWPWA